MLSIKNVDTYYGAVHAIEGINMEVGEGEIVSVIGANGAGKSTLMKSIMGIVKPKNGSIEFMGEDITSWGTAKIVKNGIVYVPEGRYIFPTISVMDNLIMGAYSQSFSSKKMEELLEEMFQMFPRLKERRKQMGGTLSGGEQQMLAIARGLMSEPKLIMFDEPSLGLAPIIVSEVFDTIVKIREQKKIPVVLVEQNAYKALSISNRCYILENGKITLSGDSSVLIHDDGVRKAYLAG